MRRNWTSGRRNWWLLSCAGCSAVGAHLFRAQPLSLIGYALAYLAGSWYTVQEVWERLQQRAIDVHFLMLAVAAGQREHRRLERRGDAAVPVLAFRRAGAFRVEPHAAGDSFAVPRGAQVRHAAG